MDEWFFNDQIASGTDDFWSIVDGFFSSGSNVEVGADGSSVHISDGGINIDDPSANVSFSTNGLEVSDSNGENVSISSDGIKVSDGSSNGTVEVNSDVDSVMDSYSEFSEYILCLKNPDNDQLILICGNDLDLLKVMAESATFK